MKKVFVSGDFNILHPGHLRLLKFAKESGDYLIVGVYSNKLSQKPSLLDESIRLESIEATSYVDEAFILNNHPIEYIKTRKPDIVVKGKEHADKENLESFYLKEYGGKLLFTSGEIGLSSLDLIKKEYTQTVKNVEHEYKFLQRHNISFNNIQTILEKFSTLNILVIGDVIVDEYITCEALGMSQEDPTIVVSPVMTDKFVGGAAIVARHAKSLGAKVKFISVCGEDIHKELVEKTLLQENIGVNIFSDSTRPTTLKQRFRANNKTLLRVNHLKQHDISIEYEKQIEDILNNSLDELDLIILSDFSYGVFTDKLITTICNKAQENDVMVVADSQSSSQIGDISKFIKATLVTPTEREIRLALNDFDSGLVVLSEKLASKLKTPYIITTLGSEGLMIYNTNKDELLTENINALGNVVKDVSGAGDSLMTSSAMALAVGANIFEAAYLGSVSSAIQVSRVGNIPIKKEEILKELN